MIGVPCVMEPVNESRLCTAGRINPSVLGTCSTGSEFAEGDATSGVPCMMEPPEGRDEFCVGGVDLGG